MNKEEKKELLVRLGCLALVSTALYALMTGRVLELVLKFLIFIAIIKIVDYFIISKFSERKRLSIRFFFLDNILFTGLLFFAIFWGSFFFGNRIIDGLTSVETLTYRIYEDSKYKFSGSKCNDGWTSFSQGKGACSWHEGVDYEFYKGEYSKTLEECRKEAKMLSWRD